MVRTGAIVVTLAALALPTAAASPQNDGARLRREVATLKAQVKRLAAANNKLSRANKKLLSANKALKTDNGTISQAWDASLRRGDALKRHILANDPCPITRPNNSKPPGPTFGAEFHGNGALWVGLWTSNIVAWQAGPDGSIDAKFGWWRAVDGKLRIEGKRLDAAAPPLTAEIPDGYGDSGFQATGIIFPTNGCWEVTGSVGSTSLTFVTLVIGA